MFALVFVAYSIRLPRVAVNGITLVKWREGRICHQRPAVLTRSDVKPTTYKDENGTLV